MTDITAAQRRLDIQERAGQELAAHRGLAEHLTQEAEAAAQPTCPSAEDTTAALDGIAKGRADAATGALTALACAVIRAVRNVDMSHNVSAYVKNISIVCTGPGIFRLNIEDCNTEADISAVQAAVHEELMASDYHKVLRPIVLEPGDG